MWRVTRRQDSLRSGCLVGLRPRSRASCHWNSGVWCFVGWVYKVKGRKLLARTWHKSLGAITYVSVGWIPAFTLAAIRIRDIPSSLFSIASNYDLPLARKQNMRNIESDKTPNYYLLSVGPISLYIFQPELSPSGWTRHESTAKR